MTFRNTNATRLALGIALGAIVVFALWEGLSDDTPPLPETLNVYCFSAMEGVMRDTILPAFIADREAATGQRVELITAYAGSGTITERIIREFPAGIAILASEVDADRLLYRGVVGVSWKRLPHEGVLASSPLLLATRSGNPRGLAGYADLARQGLAVVEADPLTSGLGEWGILAVHAAGPGADAADRVAAFRANAASLGRSAEAAARSFAAGQGDVWLGYESLIVPLDDVAIVVPDPAFLAEHVVVRIDRNVGAEQRDLADAFLDFLWSEKAQQALAEAGFRSVDPERNTTLLPVPRTATLADLGGAGAARRVLERYAPSGK